MSLITDEQNRVDPRRTGYRVASVRSKQVHMELRCAKGGNVQRKVAQHGRFRRTALRAAADRQNVGRHIMSTNPFGGAL